MCPFGATASFRVVFAVNSDFDPLSIETVTGFACAGIDSEKPDSNRATPVNNARNFLMKCLPRGKATRS